VFEYACPEGAWTVAVEESQCPGLKRVMVSDGRVNRILPLLMDDENVKHTLEKLRRLPKDRIMCYDLFSCCVAGAASLSMKFDR